MLSEKRKLNFGTDYVVSYDSEWKSTTDQQKWDYAFPPHLLPHPHNFLTFFSDQNLYILHLERTVSFFSLQTKGLHLCEPWNHIYDEENVVL